MNAWKTAVAGSNWCATAGDTVCPQHSQLQQHATAELTPPVVAYGTAIHCSLRSATNGRQSLPVLSDELHWETVMVVCLCWQLTVHCWHDADIIFCLYNTGYTTIGRQVLRLLTTVLYSLIYYYYYYYYYYYRQDCAQLCRYCFYSGPIFLFFFARQGPNVLPIKMKFVIGPLIVFILTMCPCCRVQPTLPPFVVIIVVSGPTNTACNRRRQCFSGRRKSCLEQSATRRHFSFVSRCFPKAPQNISILTFIHCLTLIHLCTV